MWLYVCISLFCTCLEFSIAHIIVPLFPPFCTAETHITVSPRWQAVNEGENVTFICAVTTGASGVIHFNISWLKKGERIDFKREDRYYMDTRNNSMSIRGVKVLDSSTYTCVADTEIGRSEKTALLVVRGRRSSRLSSFWLHQSHIYEHARRALLFSVTSPYMHMW